ncbi:MAG: Eco57I restriction-modification methylase domain-containing protein [Rickettsiales bacterium]|nr:Eco57I restriction-modification methylase domain-containing protein [Rickettsiales bacterium]
MKRKNDILEVLSNLTNNEVLTSVSMADKMLDILPQEVFDRNDTTFLDPVSKSGVFLRQIVVRLLKAKQKQYQNEAKFDVDFDNILSHILEKQVFGIATSRISWYLTRRTLYMDLVNEDYKLDVVKTYKDGLEKEDYYRFNNVKMFDDKRFDAGLIKSKMEEFDMKFDVIVGNPPYQMTNATNDGTIKSANTLYHLFVEQAIKLEPKYITMIIPSRWTIGGKGLKDFRKNMLKDKRMKQIFDFVDETSIFEGMEIGGGLMYFLWQKDYNGKCKIITDNCGKISQSERYMLEDGKNVFIRYSEAIPILNKLLTGGGG